MLHFYYNSVIYYHCALKWFVAALWNILKMSWSGLDFHCHIQELVKFLCHASCGQMKQRKADEHKKKAIYEKTKKKRAIYIPVLSPGFFSSLKGHG